MFNFIKFKNLLKRWGFLKRTKNSDLYENINENWLEKYDIDYLVAAISEYHSPEEWEDLMWEQQMFFFECIENGYINIELSSEKLKNNSKSIWKTFALFIPKQYREIIVGDLIECRLVMRRKGYGKFKITLMIGIKVLIILFAFLKIRLSDFFVKGRDIEKNR